jgi:hypothetical protein
MKPQQAPCEADSLEDSLDGGFEERSSENCESLQQNLYDSDSPNTNNLNQVRPKTNQSFLSQFSQVPVETSTCKQLALKQAFDEFKQGQKSVSSHSSQPSLCAKTLQQ